MLLAYSNWTGVVEERPYNNRRIWGTFSPVLAGGDRPAELARAPRHLPTIARGVLFLPDSPFSVPRSLFSVDGRKALDLQPGDNDIRALAPGVYYVGPAPDRPTTRPEVRKIVVTR